MWCVSAQIFDRGPVVQSPCEIFKTPEANKTPQTLSQALCMLCVAIWTGLSSLGHLDGITEQLLCQRCLVLNEPPWYHLCVKVETAVIPIVFASLRRWSGMRSRWWTSWTTPTSSSCTLRLSPVMTSSWSWSSKSVSRLSHLSAQQNYKPLFLAVWREGSCLTASLMRTTTWRSWTRCCSSVRSVKGCGTCTRCTSFISTSRLLRLYLDLGYFCSHLSAYCSY